MSEEFKRQADTIRLGYISQLIKNADGFGDNFCLRCSVRQLARNDDDVGTCDFARNRRKLAALGLDQLVIFASAKSDVLDGIDRIRFDVIRGQQSLKIAR